ADIRLSRSPAFFACAHRPSVGLRPNSLLWPKESNMKRMMFATLAFFLLTTLVSLAQEPATQDSTKATAAQEKQEHKAMSHAKTVTGCLQKGDEPGEFSITSEDGKTWGLRSTNVKLDQHVGHQVTVTGSAHRESKAQEK